MGDHARLSHLRELFDAALHEYQKQTGIALAEHPLADKLQNCDTVESITAVLCEQTQAFSEFQRNDKVLKPLKKAISVLYKLSATADFGQDIGLHFPPMKAINTGLAVLLSAIKGCIDDYGALIDLFESIEHFLNRLDIYTRIPPTVAMTEVVVKLLIELLSTLALATKQIKEGKSKKLVKKLFGGEKDIETVLQRLDRLTLDEARITTAQTFEVVCSLFQNMRVVMNDGKASADHIMDIFKTLQQLANNLNKSKRDSLQKDISNWLSPPDPWKNHHIACESRHHGSAAWFIEGNTFSEWKATEAPSSSLWIHGKPGAGKSVFCSTIIDHVDAMRKVGLASLTFFYFDFREDQKKELRGLLSSLLVQLCHQSDSYYHLLSDFYLEHAEGLRHPSDDALARCLKELLKLPGLPPVYIIVDALDECPNTSAFPSPRSKVLNLLKDFINSQIPNLRICVTSRPETDIKDVLDDLIFRSVSLHEQSKQRKDIEEYIESAINTHPKNRRWKAEHKKLVIDVLTKKADGMFRWVYCQVVYICGCIPARIRHALEDLPETLDETYQRTLRDINKADWEFAHRLFHFVSAAFRPLRVEELAELLAFDFKAEPVPKFHESWRLEDPVDAVMSTCSSLLAIVDGGNYGKVIQFSHFSVKEFLTSDRLAGATDITLRRYHVSITPAHTLAAQVCLSILLHLDNNVTTRDGLKQWPLAEYAAEYWAQHAWIEDVSQIVEDGMKQLFDPSKPHLAVSIWIHDPVLPEKQGQRAERPFLPPSISLLYAAFWGFYSTVKYLVIENSHDVNIRGFSDNDTPLHLASKYGDMEIADLLIKHGAEVTAPNKEAMTPLHLASQEGQIKVARMLIESGADVSAKNKNEKTPLHIASQEGQVDVARMLIERGSDVAAQNEDGETPLLLSLRNGQEDVAYMLIECGADVTAKNNYGESPLHLASQRGQVEVAFMLIEHGAEVTVENEAAMTPLHLASQRGGIEVTRMLIERGAEVTAKNKIGETSLHLASQNGQVEVARMLIECGADVTAHKNDGENSLHLALQNGHVKVARALIEKDVDVTAKNKYGESPLHQALHMQNRDEEVIRMIIEHGADATAKDKYGEPPLHLVLLRGQLELARTLIEHGADVKAKNEDGKTPLHIVSQNGHVELAHMLIGRGANLTAQNKDGETPLHLALQNRHMEVVRVLIERDVDVAAQNKDAETLLHLASQQGQADIARMLIERGANPADQNKDGETPLHLALRWGHWGAESADLSRVLIDGGADPTAKNKGGGTPLHLASQRGQAEVARLLIERGADVKAKDEDEDTPLHLASPRGIAEVARILVDRGADVKTKNKDGKTPLHLASEWGCVELVRLLIEQGADVTAKTKDGETPLHLASPGGQVEIVRMLIEHGAEATTPNNDEETPLHLMLKHCGQRSLDFPDMLVQGGVDVGAAEKYGVSSFRMMSPETPVEVARLLVEHGAVLTARNKNAETPLHLALKAGHAEVAHMLIECGADMTTKDEDEETLLHIASQTGQAKVARILIERGADPTAKNKDGETPLYLASKWGQVEVVQILIEHGVDVTAQNKNGETPLHQVSILGKAEVARMLIEHGADVEARDKDGETPLHLASRQGQVEVARILITRGADLTAHNKEGDTSLHLAARTRATLYTKKGGPARRMQNKKLEIAGMLIDRGADMAAQNKDGDTPVHLALLMGEIEFAHTLIMRGADVTAQNKNGETPLHLASAASQEEVARELIECGADVTAKNKNGETPLLLALGKGDVEVARMLIEHGADVTAKNKDGATPLHLVLQMGQIEFACMLIERGADVTAQNEDGDTPLHLALLEGQMEFAHILIEHAVGLTAQNKYEGTPLHLASQAGQVEVVRMLIERGVDVTSRNNDGETPLHLVSTPSSADISREYAGVASILLKHGADVNAQNAGGLTPFQLASQGGLAEVTRVLLEHGADRPDTGELPGSESPLVLPPVTSPDCPAYPLTRLTDSLIPNHPSLTNPNVADREIDLPPTSSSFNQSSSNDVLTTSSHKPNCPSVLFSRRFLCSLCLAIVAVALPFFMRSVSRKLAAG